MGRKIHHMGADRTKEEHARWHAEAPELSPAKHASLMKKLGVTPEEDAEWHRTHQTLHEQRAAGRKTVNPLEIGAAFLAWCVKQGWLAQEGKQYFATKEGARELRERFAIAL